MKDVCWGVRRHVKHWYCRAVNRETPAKLPPVDPRHYDIGHHETKMGRRQVRQMERLPAVSSLQYAVALIPQKPDHQPAQDVLVLCDENGDRALGYRMRLSHNRPRLGLYKGIADEPTMGCKIPAARAADWAPLLVNQLTAEQGFMAYTFAEGITGSCPEECSHRDVA